MRIELSRRSRVAASAAALAVVGVVCLPLSAAAAENPVDVVVEDQVRDPAPDQDDKTPAEESMLDQAPPGDDVEPLAEARAGATPAEGQPAGEVAELSCKVEQDDADMVVWCDPAGPAVDGIVTVQWLRDGQTIPDATGTSYRLNPPTDVGVSFGVTGLTVALVDGTVLAIDAPAKVAGPVLDDTLLANVETKGDAADAYVKKADGTPVFLNDTVYVGDVLKFTVPAGRGWVEGATYDFCWTYVKDVAGELVEDGECLSTSDTYTVAATDVGKQMAVVVKATKDGYYDGGMVNFSVADKSVEKKAGAKKLPATGSSTMAGLGVAAALVAAGVVTVIVRRRATVS